MKNMFRKSMPFVFMVIVCSAVLIAFMLNPLNLHKYNPLPAESITYMCQVCHVEISPGEKYCPTCDKLPPNEKYKDMHEML